MAGDARHRTARITLLATLRSSWPGRTSAMNSGAMFLTSLLSPSFSSSFLLATRPSSVKLISIAARGQGGSGAARFMRYA
jgi:hypothetical protein